MVLSITIANVAVYLLWMKEGESPFMTDNFLVSWEALRAGRWWTLIGASFSHAMFLHILINMMVFNNFGRLLERLLGSWFILLFYLLAGLVSSFSHAFVSAWFLGEPALPALGASGAVAGLILVFSLLFPKQKILLLGIVPLPAIFGALAFIGLDIWGLAAQAEGGGLPIGHGAHLGGAFTGIVWYLLFLRGYRFRLEQQPPHPQPEGDWDL